MAERIHVLVTGGAGYIGSHAVLALIDAGHRVTVIDDLSTGVRAAVPGSVELIVGDVGDRALVGRVLASARFDTIMHFAGSIVVPESVADPLKYYRNNTAASRTLIEAAVAAGVPRFVFSSTAAVYGVPEAIPIGEDAPTRPINPYGWSKLMTEQILRDTSAATGLRHASLRYFNVAGADPAGRAGQCTPEATHLIKVAVQAAIGKRGHVEVFGDDWPTADGTGVRDYIHVSDLADAHVAVMALLRRGAASATFNCGYGRGASVRQVLDAVDRAAGGRIERRHAPRRPGDPPALVADPGRLMRAVGWTPRHGDLATIVATAVAGARKLAAKAASAAARAHV
ncbi:MAG: UDP-glucose 4-epimerase GalE, partial [Alphaproteobacteria bacterium]